MAETALKTRSKFRKEIRKRRQEEIFLASVFSTSQVHLGKLTHGASQVTHTPKDPEVKRSEQTASNNNLDAETSDRELRSAPLYSWCSSFSWPAEEDDALDALLDFLLSLSTIAAV